MIDLEVEVAIRICLTIRDVWFGSCPKEFVLRLRDLPPACAVHCCLLLSSFVETASESVVFLLNVDVLIIPLGVFVWLYELFCSLLTVGFSVHIAD